MDETATIELRRHRVGAVVLTAIWSLGIIASLLWNRDVQDRETSAFVLIEARAIIFKDIVYRNWISLKDGVYAPVSEHSPPNPYLTVPERDVVFPSGKVYTLINPAYMTRQVLELQNRERHILGHITSLKPIRPQNSPDDWEREALLKCEDGAKEVSVRQLMDGVDYQRLMLPLVTDQSCMRCHAQQGYRVGNIRGGISVSIPMAPYLETARGHWRTIAGAHGGIWIVGFIASLFWYRQSRRRVVERQRHERELLVRDTALATSSSGVALTDAAGIITYANGMLRRMWRIGDDEPLIGTPLFGILTSVDAGEVLEQLGDMGSWFAELPAVRSDGTPFFVLASGAPIRTGEHSFVGYSFSFSDISMRKSAELALKESTEALRQRNEVIERDLDIAQVVQHDMLSMKAPSLPFLDVAFRYLPVERVGGDFFSFTRTREEGLGLFIGDVSGHGVAAALFHSLIKSTIEKVERQYFDRPGAYLSRLNSELYGHMTSYFITGIYGCFRREPDTGAVRFTFANGGHPSPIVMRNSGAVEDFGAGGLVVGAADDTVYGDFSALLQPGDTVVLYTDGVPETDNDRGDMLGYDEGLTGLLAGARRDSAEATMDAIVAALDAYRAGVPFSDDVLLIGVRVR